MSARIATVDAAGVPAHPDYPRDGMSRRHPERLAELKKRYLVWEAGLPPIPEDARVSLLCGPAEMPQPVHAEL